MMKIFEYFNKIIYCLIISTQLYACSHKRSSHWSISSPDGRVCTDFSIGQNNRLEYQVLFLEGEDTVELIEASPLGILREDEAFDSLRILTCSDMKTVGETYLMKTGKRQRNRNHYNERTLHLANINGSKLDLVLRAYNDGVAFKYVFPDVDEKKYTVVKELTGFSLPQGTAWLQPYDSSTAYAPAYERNFEGPVTIGTPAPLDDGWCFPALFEVRDHWLLITESNLNDNFYASHLNSDCKNGLYTMSPPKTDEAFGYGNAKAISSLPWEMPWRVITVADKLAGIVESNLVSHVSDACLFEDFSWVKPGRASWGWWSGYLDHTHDTPEKLKKFIDFAQEMGWEYSLIDAGWDSRKGLDLVELATYPKERHVKLLLWYNSGGPINKVNAGPRDKMFDPEIREREMRRISDLGIAGIKIDFFASDKQDFIKLYRDILKDAAKFKLLVNFHGCTLPRGWSRTYPNMISSESVKGSEGYIYHADYEENAPSHNTILPFTRNVVGSMDYTPVAFSVQQVPHRTTYGHELGLSVVFESGIQHFPDKPEVYLSQPQEAVTFLREVPAAWDDTRFVAGYPGKEVVIARIRDGVWYVGGINGENIEKNVDVKLDFLDDGKFDMTVIKDGNSKMSFSIERRNVNSNSIETIKMLPVGGFVMQISRKR